MAPPSRVSGDSTPDSTERDTSSNSSASPTTGDVPSSPPDSPASPSLMTCGTLDHDPSAGQAIGNLLIFLSADSPARISPSPANAPDSGATDHPSSSSSPESQASLFGPVDSFFWKMSQVCLVPMPDGTLQPSSGRWMTSGLRISRGVYLIADGLEYPNAGGACSSLPDVLEVSVARKYFLSPRAATGILRRAAKRGKKLPEHLEATLISVAGRPTPTE